MPHAPIFTLFLAKALMRFSDFKSTKEFKIPQDPLEQVIGQEQAVTIAKSAVSQRRHLLLVSAPGTGKSMLAQAIAFHLPKPKQEISVLHNPQSPERPLVQVRSEKQVKKERSASEEKAKLVFPDSVPVFVSEKLGFRCRYCGEASLPEESNCPHCGMDKNLSPFDNILADKFSGIESIVRATRLDSTGRKETLVYERVGNKIKVVLEKESQGRKIPERKVIVPLERKTLVIATGASETELLGDVRHDPFGGHAQIGTLPFERVVPGEIHEAHEGVLFVDEVSALAGIQRFLLTAMQEKKYPITGRNPQSAGASVRVDAVPCDFILVAASNINDLPSVLPALRSRISGNGYEILLNSFMPDTEANRLKFLQFCAQEIRKDSRIPHASIKAVAQLLSEAKKRAFSLDGQQNAISLRLRELSGALRLAGDLALEEKSKLTEPKHVSLAIAKGRSAEEQLRERFGSLWKAGASEFKENNREAKEIQ
jgi:predicted ATP-dependent protease